jgi:hypothetical protein
LSPEKSKTFENDERLSIDSMCDENLKVQIQTYMIEILQTYMIEIGLVK